MKYTVQCGAFATVFRHRKLTVYASSQDEAVEKAQTGSSIYSRLRVERSKMSILISLREAPQMGIRLVDKSKKSNIKCEYCKHFTQEYTPTGQYSGSGFPVKAVWCQERGEFINYWNRCKHFEWNPEKQYVQDQV